jgi:hypothetical protein
MTLTVASAICAILAAVLWLYASLATVKPSHAGKVPHGQRFASFHGAPPIAITASGKPYDLIATVHKQGIFNSMAALAASGAAIFQALALIFPASGVQ